MNFRTARLHLRPLAQTDAPAIFAMMSDAQTMRFWDWPAIRDPGVVEEIVAGQLAGVAGGDALYWVVSPTAEGPAIGSCDFSEIDSYHRRAEIGFLFHRDYWGQGYAQEAMQALIAHAFGPMELQRLWARFHAGNEASQRLLEKLGFTYEGRLKAHVLRDGLRRDCLIFGRSR